MFIIKIIIKYTEYINGCSMKFSLNLAKTGKCIPQRDKFKAKLLETGFKRFRDSLINVLKEIAIVI